MDPLRNPFSPGAGNPPPVLAGRDELLQRAQVLLHRIKNGRYEQSLMLAGLRGAGKTVLLQRIRAIAKADGYAAVSVEAAPERSLAQLLAPGLRGVLLKLDAAGTASAPVKLALRVLRSFLGAHRAGTGELEAGLGVDPERGRADSGELGADLADLFAAAGAAAGERRAAVVFLIDEIQRLKDPEMGALIQAVQRVAQKRLPLAVVAAGLPPLVESAGRCGSAAERLFQYPAVGPLARPDAMAAVRAPIEKAGATISERALARIVDEARGCPYFLQEWAYQAWNLARRSPIDVTVLDGAGAAALRRLDENFFRVRFDRLTPREKEYLRALAGPGPGPHRSGAVSERLGLAVQAAAPLRAGLMRKGVIYSPARGDTAFTAPRFDEFVRRALPREPAVQRPRRA